MESLQSLGSDVLKAVAVVVALGILGASWLWIRDPAVLGRIVLRYSLRHYRRHLHKISSSLPVVGELETFAMDQVYVELELAHSDLGSLGPDSSSIDDTGDQVIVAGPGAGKSTYAKKQVLDGLGDRSCLVFFLRLRDYGAATSMEEALRRDLEKHKVTLGDERFRRWLLSSRVLCVLDGLDEVGGEARDSVAKAVNDFFAAFFCDVPHRQLIVSCRKEAYRNIPLDIPTILEVRPLTDAQIERFAEKWPLSYPEGKSPAAFWDELCAEERIIELARTPLMLVGALILYTGSNLGVPDERVLYYERLADWLIRTWRETKRMKPDPLCRVYQKALAKLALHMHEEEETELHRATAEELLASWLRDWGRRADEGAHIVDGILETTGVLVRDAPQVLVFSCLGLQEYFASVQAHNDMTPEEIASKCTEDWWREVVLLAVAQLANPSEYLSALFARDPVMGCLAVAECPTPPLAMQDRAIHEALQGLAVGDQRSTTAVTSLLRKVTGDRETRLSDRLEGMLVGDDSDTKEAAGRVLALAGTTAATHALVRHPDAWEDALAGSEYLSMRLENLLLGWVLEGTDEQSRLAIEVLPQRASADTLRGLAAKVPELPPQRGSILAGNLLSLLGRLEQRRYGQPDYHTAVREASFLARYLDRPLVVSRDTVAGLVYALASALRLRSPGVISLLLHGYSYRGCIALVLPALLGGLLVLLHRRGEAELWLWVLLSYLVVMSPQIVMLVLGQREEEPRRSLLGAKSPGLDVYEFVVLLFMGYSMLKLEGSPMVPDPVEMLLRDMFLVGAPLWVAWVRCTRCESSLRSHANESGLVGLREVAMLATLIGVFLIATPSLRCWIGMVGIPLVGIVALYTLCCSIVVRRAVRAVGLPE